MKEKKSVSKVSEKPKRSSSNDSNDAPQLLRTRSNRAVTFGSTSNLLAFQNVHQDVRNGEMPAATLENLARYLDWRNPQFSRDDVNPELWIVANEIWTYLPPPQAVCYSIRFDEATNHSVAPSKPPLLIATSPKGTLAYAFHAKKNMIDYEEQVTIVAILPKIDSIFIKGSSSILTARDRLHATFWEIRESEDMTHLVFDNDESLYFTNGETINKIEETGCGYKEEYSEFWSPSGDTCHVTSLWRQESTVFFTVQDWNQEEDVVLYKIKDKVDGVGPNSPSRRGSNASSRSSPRSSPRNSPKSSPQIANAAQVIKVRTYSLMFNQRVWQLRWLRYEKKFLLGLSACHAGMPPQFMRIGIKKELKLFPIVGKKAVWPRTYSDSVPHIFIMHKPSRTWLLVIPCAHKSKQGDVKNCWVQFKFDSTKKKVVWARFMPILDDFIQEGEIIFYDEIRDCLIGWEKTTQHEYELRFLPDLSKFLIVEQEQSQDKKQLSKAVRKHLEEVDKKDSDKDP